MDNNLEPGEELEIILNSPGGSVYAGLATANIIRDISKSHKTVCIVEGLAASAATLAMCACDEIRLHNSSLLMFHLAYTATEGNAEELREVAKELDVIGKAMLAIYRDKFPTKSDAELMDMLSRETWMTGTDARDFGLVCETMDDEREYKIAAMLRKVVTNETPEKIRDLLMESKIIEEPSTVEEVKAETVPEETPEETTTEETSPEDPTPEETAPEAKAEEETVPLAEVNRRVSGMQSKMAKQIDALRRDYDSKILNFTNQLKVKDEELTTANARITSLTTDLESAQNHAKELSERTSALESENAELIGKLATLNASVLTTNAVAVEKPWRILKGEALVKWCREHPNAR